jgi:hypothetical protein
MRQFKIVYYARYSWKKGTRVIADKLFNSTTVYTANNKAFR